MMPGMNGLDPRKMQALMKQMGIQNNELDAEKVIIELRDGSQIIVTNPAVTEIIMQGNRSYQIAGDISLKKGLIILEEDIEMVSESAEISKEKAKELLEKTNGDIAEAISLAKE
jgi:nascent polypeptide-associated complex subunit alpha